jgi:gas vesicle protein
MFSFTFSTCDSTPKKISSCAFRSSRFRQLRDMSISRSGIAQQDKEVDSMKNVVKSILKTAVYFLDQTDRFAEDVRDRVADTVDNGAQQVSDVRDRAHDLYAGDNHNLRSALTFAAGVGIGLSAAILLAPASGEETRNAIGEKVQDIGGRVRDCFSSVVRSATGTEG